MFIQAAAKVLEENPKVTISIGGLVAIIVFFFGLYFWMTSTFALADTVNNNTAFFSNGLELNRLSGQLESKKNTQSSIQQEVIKNQIRVNEQMREAQIKKGKTPSNSDFLILETQKVELGKVSKEVEDLQKKVDALEIESSKIRTQMQTQPIKK